MRNISNKVQKPLVLVQASLPVQACPCLLGRVSPISEVYCTMKPYSVVQERCQYVLSENYLLEHNRVEQYLQIRVIKGDVSAVLERAAQTNHLSDWIISMASFCKHEHLLYECLKRAIWAFAWKVQTAQILIGSRIIRFEEQFFLGF